MAPFETTLGTLAEELDNIEAVFRGLSHAEWATRTQVSSGGSDLATLDSFRTCRAFRRVHRIDTGLIAGRSDDQPARDRTSFFINPRSETAPVVYEYAYTMD